MKKAISVISGFLILLVFSSCITVEDNRKDTAVILKCENGDTYYSDTPEEKNAVLKIMNSSSFPDFTAIIRYFNHFGYTDVIYLIDTESKEILEEYEINIDDKTWGPGFLFSPKNLEKITSILHKAAKHEDEIVNQDERRAYVEKLKSDENVVFIKKDENLMRQDGYFKIYVPASSKEEMTGWQIGEIQDELASLYGYGSVFAIDLLPLTFFPEDQEAELTVHGPRAFYEKIKIYRKSEFKESNWYKTVEYYTKH